MPSILVIINPIAGRGRVKKHWQDVRQGLIEAGIEFDLAETSAPLEAISIAQQAATKYKTVIAVGGDGTIHEVVNGLLRASKELETIALGVIPLGNGDDFAKMIPPQTAIIGAGIDFIIIRELVGGLYFGAKHTGVNEQGKRFVNESLEYDEEQIARIARVAFETSMKRKKVLHNIHKSNVLQSSVLWNEVLGEISQEFPEVEVRHILVDAAATYLCLNPGQFDVMVMENMFGDILSDQAGGILGSLGLMPSACIGPEKAYYEPSHGSAPDIAGQSIANPYSMIGSVAMMLEMSFSMEKEAKNCWHAMQSVFSQGYSTPDLSQPGAEVKMIDTQSFGDLVVSELAQLAC